MFSEKKFCMSESTAVEVANGYHKKRTMDTE